MGSPASGILDDNNTSISQAGQREIPYVEETLDTTEQPSPINEDEADQLQKSSTPPLQRRRRVSRACDECRKKKIKCDGKQPCIHCTAYTYDCTYNQPSSRRRNTTPQYIESLETQLKRANALLQFVFPNISLIDPNSNAYPQNGMFPRIPVGGFHPQLPPKVRIQHRREEQTRKELHDSHLESMVKVTGQLDLDEEGYWDYHGPSSGLSYLRRLQQRFGNVTASPGGNPFVKYRPMPRSFNSPKSAQGSPSHSANLPLADADLPSKKHAQKLCDNALMDADALLRIVHIPSFYNSMDRAYDITPQNYGNAENTFLPLLYAVLALGTLFLNNNIELDEVGHESAVDEGYKYFKASRQLLDIADCRDLTSLQAILFMVQFLLSSGKLSASYSYIGVAQRSALRIGLHRSSNTSFSPIEAETRKRVFWVIRNMDTYVGAILGLPHLLSDEDIDQDWLTEVDDEYITETEIRPMPQGKTSVIAGVNAHTRIVQVLAKICKYVYPIKGTQYRNKNSVTYSVSYAKIREIEQDLQNWLDELPTALKPGEEAPMIIIRVQQFLRLAFAHAQLLLYRPFLHYVSQTDKSRMIDHRALACASACLRVSRNIVHITVEMKRRGLLIGAHWFSMYTAFSAIISILYFVLGNPNDSTSNELLRDAMEGKDVLAQYAKRNIAADRCTATLNIIFDKLPDWVKRGADIIGSEKHQQRSSPPSLRSRPNLLKQDLNFTKTGQIWPPQASIFLEPTPNSKHTILLQPHFTYLALDSFYGQSLPQSSSDFLDPASSLTLTSTTSNLGDFSIPRNQTPQQRPAQSFLTTSSTNTIDPTSLSIPVSDVATMMFPSTDSFTYPNQPMMTFEIPNLQGFDPKNKGSPGPGTGW